jgi:hypothetical protein
MTSPHAMRAADVHHVVGGSATIFRLYDVGYEIDLPRAAQLIAPSAPSSSQPRPRRGEGAALVTPRPPLMTELGSRPVTLAGAATQGRLTVAIFDFGVISLRVHLDAPHQQSWSDYVDFANALHGEPTFRSLCDATLRELLSTLGPAIQRQGVASVTEDYIVFRVTALCDGTGAWITPPRLSGDALAALLLNESRELSPAAKRELLPHRFAYTTRDFAALTWESALVVEPDPADRDVEYVLEFANAQLLELRVFDAMLDAELPRMYDRVAAVRRRPTTLFRRYRSLLAGLQTLVADTTEIVERVENALKVTDDVYLARVYSAALTIFRGSAWRRGIDRKLEITRDTYAMLNAESQAARGEVMELSIILLIVGEILLSVFGRH